MPSPVASPVIPMGGAADSTGGGNSVTTPGAGSSFTSLSAPPAGMYRIDFGYVLTATAETSLTNVQLRVNAATLLGSLPSLSGAGWVYGTIPRITLDGTNLVQLRAAALATTGAQYSGFIVLTKLQ